MLGQHCHSDSGRLAITNYPKGYTMVNAIPQELVELAKHARDEATKAASEYRAATGSKSDAVNNVLNTSDDEQIVKYREWRDEVQAKIEELTSKLDENTNKVLAYAENLVQSDAGDPEEIKARFLEHRANATKSRKMLVEFFGEDAFNEAVGEFDIPTLRGTSTSGSTGVKRPRLQSATVNGEDVTDKNGKVSFTILAGHITSNYGRIKGADLRDAAFKAAGTDDLSSLNEGTEVKFTVNVDTTVDGSPKTNTVEVTFVPQVKSSEDETE